MKTLFEYLAMMIKDNIIVEMATERKDLRGDIINYQPLIVEHLLYLKLYPDSRDIEHWKMEIIRFINKFSDKSLKPNNKKADYKFYFDYLWKERYENRNGDFLPNLYKRLIKKEGKSLISFSDLNINEIDNELKEFYSNVSKLCANKFVVEDEDLELLIDKWHNNKI